MGLHRGRKVEQMREERGVSVKRERKIGWERLGIKRGKIYKIVFLSAFSCCPSGQVCVCKLESLFFLKRFRWTLQASCNGGLIGCWACVVGIEK